MFADLPYILNGQYCSGQLELCVQLTRIEMNLTHIPRVFFQTMQTKYENALWSPFDFDSTVPQHPVFPLLHLVRIGTYLTLF